MLKTLVLLGGLALASACGSNGNGCYGQSCIPSGNCNCVSLAACSTAYQGAESCGVGMVCCPPFADGGPGTN